MQADWEEMKREYFSAPHITLKMLAEKYEIAFASLKRRAVEQGWYREKTARLKRAQPEANPVLAQQQKINDIADKLLENIRESCEVTDKPTSIYNLTSALKNLTAIIRDVNEMPNWKDRQSLELSRLKLDAAKQKQTVDEEGGVILLPALKDDDILEMPTGQKGSYEKDNLATAAETKTVSRAPGV